MSTIKRFEDLEIWMLARELSNSIWNLTLEGTLKLDYGLKDQINRSTGSAMDNIAEGFGRGGNKEFTYFLGISRASNDEVRSQLYRASDRNHISIQEFEDLKRMSENLGIKTSKLMNYLRRSGFEGKRY